MSVNTLESKQSQSRIRRLLNWTRFRLRLTGFIGVVAWSVTLLVVLSLLTFLVDREWEPTVQVRLPFVLFMLGILTVGILSSLWAWLRRDLSDDQVALMIESENPQLQSALISSVQLARELGGDDIHSEALINSVITDSVDKVSGLKTARPARLLPALPGFIGAGALLAAGVSTFFMPGTENLAKIWRDRVLFMDSQLKYPTPVDIEIVIPKDNAGQQPFEVYVVRGEDLTVNCRITRGGTEKIEILTRFETSNQREQRTMARISDDVFAKTYQNVTEPFSFRADAGYGVLSDIYTVKLIDRARVEQARFWLDYPAYTHLKPTPENEPVTRTYLDVPVGTIVRYQVVSSLPVEEAQLFFYTGSQNEKVEDGPKAQVAKDGELAGRLVFGQFQAMNSLRFRFSLKSADGVTSDKSSVLYSVKALEDRPPVVTFRKPGRSQAVTKNAVVPMELSVKDQYGIDRTELRLKIMRNGAPLRNDKRPLEQSSGDEQKALFQWSFSISDLELREGDQIEYYAVAFDRNIDETKRAGNSLAYTFTIVSNDDLQRILQDRLIRLKDDLQAAGKAQELARKDMANIKDKLALRDKFSKDDQRQLTRVETSQRAVSKRMKQITEAFSKLKELRKINGIRDEREDVLQNSLEKASKEIAEVMSPGVVRDIRDLVSRPNEPNKSKLARIPDRQEAISQAIQGLVDKLDKWGDISDADRELKAIIEQELQIYDKTGKKLKQNN